MPRLDSRRLAVAAVALVVAATLAWWGYAAYARWQARKTAAEVVKDTGTRLREVLGASAQAMAPAEAEVTRIEAQLAQVERNYARLRQLDTAALRGLAEATDDYVLTSREILRRVAIASRARLDLAASSQALRSHMGADRGRAAWPREAVKLRERVDEDYRNFRLASETLIKLIDTLPVSQERLAGHLDTSVRVDPQVLASVRTTVLGTAKQAAIDVERLTDLASYR